MCFFFVITSYIDGQDTSIDMHIVLLRSPFNLTSKFDFDLSGSTNTYFDAFRQEKHDGV